jgi:hypothetical protein
MPSPLSDVYCCVIRPFVRGPWIEIQHDMSAY